MATKNQYLVVGFKKIDYVKQKGANAGQEVHGKEVYLQAIQIDEGVVGEQVEAIYLNDKYSVYIPCVGDEVRKTYNQWGKVEDLAQL